LRKREKLAIIREHYPTAVTVIDSLNDLIDFVEEILDLEPSQIMMADSICSDDVNSIQYPVRAQEFLGPFKMGGLDGYPFTGLTGMSAFASHVPDEGAVYIYYGPHIGISKSGTVGEIQRYGQSKHTDCCGATKGALRKLLNNDIIPGAINDMDYQMNTIEQILYEQRERITESRIPLLEATEVIYESIDQRIEELVSRTDYHSKYVILQGGILINSDIDMGSFTALKRFDVINLQTKERKSWLNLR